MLVAGQPSKCAVQFAVECIILIPLLKVLLVLVGAKHWVARLAAPLNFLLDDWHVSAVVAGQLSRRGQLLAHDFRPAVGRHDIAKHLAEKVPKLPRLDDHLAPSLSGRSQVLLYLFPRITKGSHAIPTQRAGITFFHATHVQIPQPRNNPRRAIKKP